MDRFYLDSDCKVKSYIDDKDEIKHITKVMRMKEGDLFEIFDITGKEYVAKITVLDKDKVDFVIEKECFEKRELETKITLYQGLPKQQKMEYIIQKTTELGVMKIIPCKLKRCVSELKEKEERKVERWQKIALEAVKQSKRTVVPKVEFSMSIKEILEDMKNNEVNIVFYELEKIVQLKKLIQTLDNPPKTIGILVGPEGGLTDNEIESFVNAGAYCVTLGNRILRTETAAMYAVAILAYEFQ